MEKNEVRAVVAIVGTDRAGLTRGVSEAILAAGGNWLESHLTRLAGQYVGAVLVELAAGSETALRRALKMIDSDRLLVLVVPVTERPEVDCRFEQVEIVAQDRPGIVHEVTSALAALNVNIDELETRREGGAWSGDVLFKAKLRLGIPDGVEPERVQLALEDLSADLMVDFCVAEDA